jgi:cellulose synthase/poly-beta-1,6-N-acetylglucosamine synthase-like glycosyltransferase
VRKTLLGLILWTHAGYPALLGLLAARRRPEAPRSPSRMPSAALVIAAHNEEAVIAERLENALALDYPDLEIIVTLDGSDDATGAIARESPRVTVLDNPRAGKVAAQNAAVRATSAEIVAFSDANSMWAPDALRRLVARLADPEVGYVCGRLELVDPASGANVEGVYWRYELWQREQESRLGSITAGNGAIYAVRRSAYVELGPGQSHDIGLPFRLRRSGLRALYEPTAVATEMAAPTTSAEWPRKVRMLSRAWHDVLGGGMLSPRGLPAGYYAALISHRLLRYATGPLHLLLLAVAGPRLRAAHAAWGALALAGSRGAGGRLAGLAWYYLVVTAASVAGLVRMLVHGPQATWEAVR